MSQHEDLLLSLSVSAFLIMIVMLSRTKRFSQEESKSYRDHWPALTQGSSVFWF